MKLDMKRINTLCSMSDDRLWGTVKFFAAANGIDLSKKRVAPKDVESLRRTLRSLTSADVERINQLADIYKYGR